MSDDMFHNAVGLAAVQLVEAGLAGDQETIEQIIGLHVRSRDDASWLLRHLTNTAAALAANPGNPGSREQLVWMRRVLLGEIASDDYDAEPPK